MGLQALCKHIFTNSRPPTRPPQSAQSTRFSCRHVFGLPGTIAKIVIWSVQWYIKWMKTDKYEWSRYRKAWKQQSLTLKVAWDKVEGCFLLQAHKRSENSCRHHFTLWRPGPKISQIFLPALKISCTRGPRMHHYLQVCKGVLFLIHKAPTDEKS